MRCEYRFRVSGRLRLDQSHPITLNAHIYRFHTTPDTKRVDAVSVEVRADDSSSWPTVTRLPPDPANPRAPKFNVNIPSPEWDAIREEIQTIEGLLSIYGLDSIDTENLERCYIPDNESEAQCLQANNFQVSRQPLPDSAFPLSAFDVIARSVLAANELRVLQAALGFFRKGRIDMQGARFIDAFYDFFFVIETLFADGKSRASAMADAFRGSPVLLTATREALAGEGLRQLLRNRAHLNARFVEKYLRPDPLDALGALIETRGFLHHHSGKRPGAWHPNRNADFEIDANVAQEIASQVVFALTHDAIFSEGAIERYQELYSGRLK